MHRIGTIATFYSYKGGVGRSMALANVALLLARRGLRTLIVDWDLEAPGLERYFGYFSQSNTGAGLLSMFLNAATNGIDRLDYRTFCTFIDTKTTHPITLLASGREQNADYSRELESFDWQKFFSCYRGGEFVEQLRNSWRQDFDITLVDSRTGLSDTGGICTIQLPDVIVAMFTANLQSLYGVRDVMRLAQRARQSLAYERMPLTILPLAARWGMQEFQESEIWLNRVVEGTQEFFDDWLPRPLTVRDVIERLRLPQQDFFGFGERLAVVEQGVANPAGLGFIYERVAGILEHNFAKIGNVLGIADNPPTVTSKPLLTERGATLRKKDRLADGYRYDLFVSYDKKFADPTVGLVDALRRELALMLPDGPEVFVDVTELRLGEDWVAQIDEALARSRVMLVVLTPSYSNNRHAMRELRAFRERGNRAGRQLIVSAAFSGEGFSKEVEDLAFVDFSEIPLAQIRMASSPQVHKLIHQLANLIMNVMRNAPPFHSDWKQLNKDY